MRILNQSRLYLFIIFVITLVLSTTSWAKRNDIRSYRVLSQSQSEMVIEIYSYYNGNRGPKVALSVWPTINNQPSSYVGYSSGRSCKSEKSNYLSLGKNTTCMTLTANAGVNQFVTNGLQICMFEVSGSRQFYCENFTYRKKWGVNRSGSNQPPTNQNDDILKYNIRSQSRNYVMFNIQSYYTGRYGPTAWISVQATSNGLVNNSILPSRGCPTNNAIITGSNSTCISLILKNGVNHTTTNGLKVCMFGAPQYSGSFYCETLGFTKTWTAP